MDRKRRWMNGIILLVCLLYAGGLAVGTGRLAWAAINNLQDAELLTDAPAVSIDDAQTSVSSAQRAYLLRRIRISPTPTTPRIHVNVRWNALVCARVAAGHFVGPTGAEGKDTLFVCMFGIWVPVYTFSHMMA